MRFLFSALIALLLANCENPVKRAIRNVEYSGYEMVGIEKRDLLKKRIGETRENQEDASKSFKDALEKLRAMYGSKETDLSRKYRDLNSTYEKSEGKAKDARESAERMRAVARDLFREWEDEIDQIQTADLKARSAATLRGSRAKFATLDKSLSESENKMQTVLQKLKDYNLFLKHNLNAESLASLKNEHDRIGKQIEDLTRDAGRAIEEANNFSKTLP